MTLLLMKGGKYQDLPYGLLDSEKPDISIHDPDKCVPVDELLTCTQTHALFTYRWCNEKY
ncbi:MAG: hypothetical protein ACUVWJ_11435 [Spirochaetota bacterium]